MPMQYITALYIMYMGTILNDYPLVRIKKEQFEIRLIRGCGALCIPKLQSKQ